MQIEVLGEDTISRQARIYAEYRLFAVLSQVVDTDQVRHVRVMLRPKHNRGYHGISCTVRIETDRGEAFRIRAVGDHPYAAINRAVERLQENRWPPRLDSQWRSLQAVAE
jgi:ribosome-associated translation inhibitor RaiA